MHDDPRNRKRSTPAAAAASNRFAWIRRLSCRNSTGRAAFAAIPPTRAAASTTATGATDPTNSRAATASRRSTCADRAPTTSENPAPRSARTTADPTNPPEPATRTRPDRSSSPMI